VTLARIRAARQRLPENVRALGWISLANDAASELAYPIVPLFLTITLGAPVTVVGLIEGIAEGLATGMKLLSGWLSDRMGERRKPWILGGYGASTAARAIVAAAPAWGWVLVGRVIDRLGKGARGTPRDALIRDSTPHELLGSSFGYHRAMDTAGAIVGPLVAAGLLWWGTSLRTILWVSFALGAAVLLLLRRVREAPEATKPASKVSLKREPLPAGYWAVLGIWVVFSLGNSSDAFLILRARDLGMGAVLVVLAYAVYNVLYASLSWPFGALSDRWRRTVLMGGGLAVFALVYLGFAFAPGSWAVWPLFAVYGVYIAATEGVARAWVADHLVDRRAVGTAYGIFFLATAAAALVASVAAGLLWVHVSTRAPFLLGAGTAVVALILLLAFEAGWTAKSRTVKSLLAAGAALAIAGIVVVAVEHGSIASALESESALPGAIVRPCGPAPAAADVPPPSRFPRPGDAHFTDVSHEGPTTVVTGWFENGVRDARDAFEAGLRGSGYTVLRSELDVADSEVNFAGRGTTGQVKLVQECRDRSSVRVTIRPE
jgi:MFS family permease